MYKYISIIKNTSLFSSLSEDEIKNLLKFTNAKLKEYKSKSNVIEAGEKIESFGLLLKGSLLIVNNDYWGNRNIIGKVKEGQLFAETFACIPKNPLTITVSAESDSEVLFLNMNSILSFASENYKSYESIIKNILLDIVRKNLYLNKKIMHMSKRSTREKLLTYLSDESIKHGSDSFKIPFKRQELADYLSVDRSAMSNELSKLKKEGFIDFDKNKFTLIKI